jgi:hypothetical protein
MHEYRISNIYKLKNNPLIHKTKGLFSVFCFSGKNKERKDTERKKKKKIPNSII